MNRAFDARLIVGLALVVITLLGSVGVALVNTYRLYDDANEVSHTFQVVAALEGVLSDALDAETGQRGFIVTGDESFLEPYNQAIAVIHERIDGLQRLTIDNPRQQAEIPALRELVDVRLAKLDENIRRRREDGLEAAREDIQQRTGKQMMDRVRERIAEMVAVERQLLTQRADRYRESFRTAVITASAAGVLGLAMVAAFLYLLQKSLAARARAAAEVHQERERLRVTLASIGDGVIATDVQGRVTFLNAVAESLCGWKQEDAAGKTLESIFHIVNETTRAEVDNPAMRALQQGAIVGLANHTVLIARDGSERAIADSAAPIRGLDDTVLGAILVFRDVTEDRTAERALEASEALKSAILDSALDAIVTCNAEGHVVEFNPAAERMFGYRRDAILGHDLGELIVPSGLRDRHRRGMERYLATGVPVVLNRRIELSAKRSDGSEFPCELAITRITGVAAPFFTAHIRDISDRKRSEQELRDVTESSERARRLYDTILASTPDFIYVFDLNRRFSYANAALLAMFGRPWDQTVGKSFLEIGYEPWHAEMHESEIDRVVATKQPIRGEVPFSGTHGRRIYDYIFVPVFGADGAVEAVAGTTRDVTERKGLEDNLRKVAADLSEANRRKNEFLATLAHELRNPLAPIRTGLELIKLSLDDRTTIEETRDMMERQTQQMVRLIDDLLDISRITQGKLQVSKSRIDLAPIVRNAVEAVQPTIAEMGHKLTVTTPDAPIRLDGDPHRLAQVISNLLHNAAKYTPREGSIDLIVDVEGDQAVVRVKDTGLGVQPEMQSKIFDMFAQIDRPLEQGYTGLGIGLTLVKRLTEMHGGTVELRSEGTDRGSEFILRLPLPADSAAPATPVAAKIAAPAGGSLRRVLVVDDNQAAAETTAIILSRMQYDTRTAHDGLEALRVAAEFLPEVVLMDLGMPNLNGYETARRIRMEPWGREMILIALTGWGQDGDKQRTRDAGFDEHLVKPVDPGTLHSVLHSMQPRG